MNVPACPAPATACVTDEPTASAAGAPATPRSHLHAAASFAYRFVRDHAESIASLVRLIRGDYRAPRGDRDDQR